MPTPRQNESRSDFISRCIPDLKNEGRPQDQAIAVCHSMWRDSKRNKGTDNEQSN